MHHELPPKALLLASLCVQHKTGDAAADVATGLGIFTECWLSANTFTQGDSYGSLRDHMLAILMDPEKGLQVEDPATLTPDAG